jgi:hypothetical protein
MAMSDHGFEPAPEQEAVEPADGGRNDGQRVGARGVGRHILQATDRLLAPSAATLIVVAALATLLIVVASVDAAPTRRCAPAAWETC